MLGSADSITFGTAMPGSADGHGEGPAGPACVIGPPGGAAPVGPGPGNGDPWSRPGSWCDPAGACGATGWPGDGGESENGDDGELQGLGSGPVSADSHGAGPDVGAGGGDCPHCPALGTGEKPPPAAGGALSGAAQAPAPEAGVAPLSGDGGPEGAESGVPLGGSSLMTQPYLRYGLVRS
ncbi:hypothetical protein ABT297_03820 [Dactylosporangium sp. NPDC000555]|uniref:hypothetical protein n=1 Tax=Dactylosporangium sp. NPDC000555 TaxID=3154260 RepID=UPI003329D32F